MSKSRCINREYHRTIVRNTTIWDISSGLFLAAISFTAAARGESPAEAYRIAQEMLSPTTEHRLSRDYSSAIKLLDRVIEAEPKHKAAYRCRGLARLLTGSPEAAIQDFDRALQLDPTDAVVYYGRASGYRFLGKTKQALADFQEAVRRNPWYRAALAGEGDIFKEQGMWREHLRIREIEKKLPDPGRGEVPAELADWRASVDFANGQHFDLNSFFVSYFWSIIYGDYRDLTGIRFDVLFGDKRLTDSETHRRTAVRHAARKDFEAALTALDRAIQGSSKNWRAFRLRAAILVVTDDLRTALATLSRAIELNSRESYLYIDRALIHTELGEMDAALRDDEEIERISEETMKAIRSLDKGSGSGDN